ncbi:MAG: hypothetical protein J0M17_25860 [Planctomycetes bacterium]|nr:hypothetical protein [Planctomycetota bacterium]
MSMVLETRVNLAAMRKGVSPLGFAEAGLNRVAAVANQLFLKMLRRVESGIHPEIEMTSTLEPQADKLPCPHLRGHWEHRQADGTRTALGIIYDFIAYERSLADWCREDLRRALESASAGASQRAADPEAGPTTADTSAPPLASAQRTFALLGKRLAEVHNALADLETPASFAPEVVSTHYRRSLHLGFSSRAQRAVEQLREWVRRGGGDDTDAAKRLLARADRIDGRFAPLMQARTLLWRIRVHGALGLDEVLLQGDDLQLVDWGGDPRRPFSERRIKRSAMVDLARLASSLHGLAFGVREDWVRQMQLTGDAADNLRAAEAAWRSACWQAFLTPYRAAVVGQLLVPDDDTEFADMFDAFRLSAAMETLLQAIELKRTDRLAGALDDCLEQVPAT